MITKQEWIGGAAALLLAGLSLFFGIRACQPGKPSLTVDVAMMGQNIGTVSNVVEVVPRHDKEQCNLVRYVAGGKTNDFHGWLCEVRDHTSGKVLAPGPTEAEKQAAMKQIEEAVAEAEKEAAK